jgi:hypothetical protein
MPGAATSTGAASMTAMASSSMMGWALHGAHSGRGLRRRSCFRRRRSGEKNGRARQQNNPQYVLHSKSPKRKPTRLLNHIA